MVYDLAPALVSPTVKPGHPSTWAVPPHSAMIRRHLAGEQERMRASSSRLSNEKGTKCGTLTTASRPGGRPTPFADRERAAGSLLLYCGGVMCLNFAAGDTTTGAP